MKKKYTPARVAEQDIVAYYPGGGPYQKSGVVIRRAELHGHWYVWDSNLDAEYVDGIKDELGRTLISVHESNIYVLPTTCSVKESKLKRILRAIWRMFRDSGDSPF